MSIGKIGEGFKKFWKGVKNFPKNVKTAFGNISNRLKGKSADKAKKVHTASLHILRGSSNKRATRDLQEKELSQLEKSDLGVSVPIDDSKERPSPLQPQESISEFQVPPIVIPKALEKAWETSVPTRPDAEEMFGDLADHPRMEEVNEQEQMEFRSGIDRFTDIVSPQKTNIGHNLHANYVDGPSGRFIAAQIPNGFYNTDNHALFWRGAMLESDLIVDLSKPGDIEKYYPTEAGETFTYEDGLSVTCTEVSEFDEATGTVISKYEVKDPTQADPQSGEPPLVRTLTRVHYQEWQDHAATATDKLVGLAKMVDGLKSNKPPIVHCRAGVGRTGTFITASNLLKMKKEGILQNPSKDLEKLVLDGRMARGEYFVQKATQLDTLLDIAYSEASF